MGNKVPGIYTDVHNSLFIVYLNGDVEFFEDTDLTWKFSVIPTAFIYDASGDELIISLEELENG